MAACVSNGQILAGLVAELSQPIEVGLHALRTAAKYEHTAVETE